MKLYHGSTEIIEHPLTSYGRKNLDFGQGFYTTDLRIQAEKWVLRFIALNKKSYVSIYNFNEVDIQHKCHYKKFNEYSEEWLDFIISCRSGGKDYLNYDIIEGGIANDKVFNTLELYFSGLIDKNTALSRLKYEKPNNQICFVDQDITDTFLHFDSSYEVKEIPV